MHKHVRRIISNETSITYCSKTIQNEIITLLASSVRDDILERTRKAKYFSIILDCTFDISHKEQFSFTLRFVDIGDSDLKIKEHFITYQEIEESTGHSLYEIIKQLMNDFQLNLDDCKGQGYDDGSNMLGKNKGVQARICKEYPRAFFVPCGCHSLNLVIGDAAISCTQSTSFFGIVQRLYTFFSASVGRWKILTDNVPLSLKPLCETRWESRIDCIKPLRFQITEIHDALLQVHENSKDAGARHEAFTLPEQICEYSFLVLIVIWYDLLSHINIVSKALQANSMDLNNAVNLLQSCSKYLENYRSNGFEKCLVDARELAELVGTEHFIQKRIRRIKRQHDYEAIDDDVVDAKQHFKINVFNILVDQIKSFFVERFEQTNDFLNNRGFLCNLKNNLNNDELRKCCMNLHLLLKDQQKSDINGTELMNEIISFKNLISGNVNSPLEILNFIKINDLYTIMPNLWTTLKILLTIPVTVAACERSFSKLKLIKTYLRSTMTNERLNSLAILSIEKEVEKNINMTENIQKFADLKARKNHSIRYNGSVSKIANLGLPWLIVQSDCINVEIYFLGP
ncbi:52 kDa repressor of the inhibitor of the protein kinase-like [Centruroides vittatus]|uniref:52 kDa repressor of the inhibitor of the protein kinase-like n=1 Tax=Centruroides vittatus TaxID=120091 RepID=UPI003510255F